MRRRRPGASLLAAMSAGVRSQISSNRRLCDTMWPSRSTTRMPSAVDSSVDLRTDTVRESATLRGFFALDLVLSVFAELERRVAIPRIYGLTPAWPRSRPGDSGHGPGGQARLA